MLENESDFTPQSLNRREIILWRLIQEVTRSWTKIMVGAVNPNVNITAYGNCISWPYPYTFSFRKVYIHLSKVNLIWRYTLILKHLHLIDIHLSFLYKTMFLMTYILPTQSRRFISKRWILINTFENKLTWIYNKLP